MTQGPGGQFCDQAVRIAPYHNRTQDKLILMAFHAA